MGSDEAAAYGEDVTADDCASPGLLADLSAQIGMELRTYDLMPLQTALDESPLTFWENMFSGMPYVALVARHIFGVPASTANVERLFNACRMRALSTVHLKLGHGWQTALGIKVFAPCTSRHTKPFRTS